MVSADSIVRFSISRQALTTDWGKLPAIPNEPIGIN